MSHRMIGVYIVWLKRLRVSNSVEKVNVIPVTSKNAATCLMSGIMTSTDDCELRKISSNPFPTMVFMWKIIFSIAQISRHQAGKF